MSALPLTVEELPKDLHHYMGDLDPDRVLATVELLYQTEHAAHAAEEELAASKAREAKLRSALIAISYKAKAERFNINTLTSSPPQNELARDLGWMAKQALENP